MSLTINDCLKLLSLQQAKVVAGHKGLDQIVLSISVLEYAVPTDFNECYFFSNELIISALISIKDDVDMQCEAIRFMQRQGEVGLILYYVGIFMQKIDKRLIETANEINFPIICMPKKVHALRYSEVICDVMEAIYKDKLKQTNLVVEILEHVSRLNPQKRTLDNVIRMISDYTRCSILVTDGMYNILAAAPWPMSLQLNYEEIIKISSSQRRSGKGRFQTAEIISDKTLIIDISHISADYGNYMYLLLIGDNLDVISNYSSQAAEILRLYINIWNHNETPEKMTELIRAIINDEPSKMRRLAEIYKFDISSIHNMWVFFKTEQNHLLIEYVTRFLKESNRLAVVGEYGENVVAFIDDPIFPYSFNDFTNSFVEDLKEQIGEIAMACIGGLLTTSDVRRAYDSILACRKQAHTIFPLKNPMTYGEITFAKECVDLIETGENAAKEVMTILAPLLSRKDDELIKTITTYMLDADSSVSKTSELLFVHKNTIKYRIKRADELLGLNIQKFPEAVLIYRAVAINRLLNSL